MNTPHARICLEAEELYKQHGRIGVAKMMATRLDPAVDRYFALAYGVQATQHLLCIWEAADGSKFILSHNSFGLWEGLVSGAGDHLHRFFAVSPRRWDLAELPHASSNYGLVTFIDNPQLGLFGRQVRQPCSDLRQSEERT